MPNPMLDWTLTFLALPFIITQQVVVQVDEACEFMLYVINSYPMS